MRHMVLKIWLLLLCGAVGFIPKQAAAGHIPSADKIRKHIEMSARLGQIESFSAKKAYLSGFRSTRRLVLGASGSISGQVLGLDLSDIGTAYVEAWKADPAVEPGKEDSVKGEWDKGLALVDSSFTYRIDSLKTGDYYVTAWADGYDAQYFNGSADLFNAAKVSVKENETTSKIDFSLTKPVPGTGSISGTVREDADGKPLAGAVVSAYATGMTGSKYTYGRCACDADGHYAIKDLKTGDYYVEVYADGFVWEMYNNAPDQRTAALVRVAEPRETAGIDFSIERSGMISGKVLGASGKPFDKAVVTALGRGFKDPASPDSAFYDFSDKYQQTVYADSGGTYIIEGLKKGSYLVLASVPAEWESMELWYNQAESISDADSVAVRPGENTEGIDFRFNKTSGYGSLSGIVTDKAGRPVEGAGISIMKQSGGSWGGWYYRYAVTDTDGYYIQERLPQGDYTVSCYARIGWQYATQWWPGAETENQAQKISVMADEPVTGVDFSLPLSRAHGSINGTVVSKEGIPLVNASIQVQSRRIPVDPLPADGNGKTISTIWAYANTDSLGRYAIQDLPAETYTVFASYWEGDRFGEGWYNGKSSGETADLLVLAADQNAAGVDFSLNVRPIYGSVTGVVRNSVTGSPIQGAYVEIRKTRSSNAGSMFMPFRAWNMNALTDGGGRYAFDRLAEGEYLLDVYTNGAFAYYKNASVPDMADTLIVKGGEKFEADLSLALRSDGNGSISGRVTLDGGWKNTVPDSSSSFLTVSSGESVLSGASYQAAVVRAKPAVSVLSYPQSEWFYSAVTDSDGTYTLTGLPAGDYYVSSFAAYCMLEYYNDTTDPAKATLVRVEKDNAVTGIDMALNPILYYWRNDSGLKLEGATSLSGRVEDDAGNAVAGASVYVLDSAGNALTFAVTGADGMYEIAGLPAGNYFVQAGKPGYATQYNGTASDMSGAPPVNVAAGANTLNFRLAPGQTTDVDAPDGAKPAGIALLGCYPNPFNPETRIAFVLPEKMRAALRVYDSRGREVAVLCEGQMEAGRHERDWKGRDGNGHAMPSGIYFYRLEAESYAKTGKMILIR